ncbi:UvrD-helicase domain-containing protein [Candidatus Nomurabacteria bacterium]|nr:UvrD-helicase domain-containing protein [Candidatus Nomurabacteria bacterium]
MILNELNESQKKAVLSTEGPLLIVAGAGAGKTKTMVHRIAHIVSTGISADKILAVTFTNKAAKEMRERSIDLLRKSHLSTDGYPFISTFHSLGVFLLRKFGAYGSKVKNFTILDDSDTTTLIKESLQSMGLDPKTNEPRALKSIISRCANALQNPEDLMSESNPTYRLAGRVWQTYKNNKEKQQALDFDDLLLQTIDMLDNNKEVLSWCQDAWHYVHIDEYQDTNEVQYRIAKALAGTRKNLCVVGDSDQSIYSWRGANIKNILEFEKDYPEAEVVLLEENYRSTKTVISAANEVIKQNNHRQPKNLFTNKHEGEPISLYGAYDETDEARFVVERCIERMDQGIKTEDIAVLFRANFQSRILEEAFLSYNIPYQVLGVRFFERKEIKDVISYLRASLNPESKLDIKRIINTPARGIGKVTINKIFEEGKESLSGKALIATQNFYDLLLKIKDYIENHNASEILKFVISETGLEQSLKDSDEEKIENLKELVTLGIRYDHLEGKIGIEKLIEEATLMSDQDNMESKEEKLPGIKLMTVHASKGLEFNTVFITGLEHGLFPHERGERLTGADAEEERRLMYVAVTRAREKLYLTYTSIRTIFGSRDIRLPSEFLSDIPDELITRESREGEAGFTVYL